MTSTSPSALAHSATTRTFTSLRAAWIPMLALCLAFFVEMVDNTLLGIALPTIARDLGSTTTQMQWVTGAYSLTFGGLLLTAGSTADRFGRRRVLLVGLAAFGLISLAVAVVTTTTGLIAVRAALGVAAAMMAPITNSIVFRLFDDERLRMRAITVMMIVGMSGFILGPLLGGSVLAVVPWQWLLLVNAPIALIAFVGVRLGVPADDRAGLTHDRLDVPGALLSIAAIGLACYALTSGVEFGWLSPITIACAAGAVLAILGFVWRERTAASPMLDLRLFRAGTVRGASIAQLGTSVAMAGVMFTLMLQYQYAYGWSPVAAGLASLPMIATMLLASPLAERIIAAFGHRVGCLIGAGCMTIALAGLTWSVHHGYLAIALCTVVMTFGLRIVMTTCAVALIGGMPAHRTSIGAAMNDAAQEVGSSLGTAIVGTLIAALVAVTLPAGTWDAGFVQTFFDGESVIFAALAILVGVLTVVGSLTLTDARTTDEQAAPEAVAEAEAAPSR